MRVKYKGAILGIVIPLSILFLFIGASLIKNNEIPNNTFSPFTYSYGHHNIGNYWVSVWNTCEEGFVDKRWPDRYCGVWPGGSGDEYLYHSSIWVGWQDSNGNVYVISQYYVGREQEWVPIEEAASTMWMSNMDGWPPEPGIKTVSDLDGWTKCDDSGATENKAIGLEIERHSYSWGVPGHYEWIVYHYILKNTGKHGDLSKIYIAWPCDFDIGGSLDYIDDLAAYEGNDTTDYYTNPKMPGQPWTDKTPDGIPDEYDAVNYDPPQQRGTSYMYDNPPANFPGFLGQRPFGYLGTYPNGEFITPSSQHSWDINNDPATDVYKYGYMIDTGVYEEITNPYDWRVCPAIGPLEDTLKIDGTVEFYVVNCIGNGLLNLRMNLDQVLADWLGADKKPGTDDDWLVAAPPQSPKLALIPEDSKVTVHWSREYEPGKNLETEQDPQTDVVDFDGYILWRSAVGFDTGWVAIAWWDKKTTDTDYCWKPFGWRVTGNSDPNKDERVPDGLNDNTQTPSATEPDLRFAKQFTYEDDLYPQLNDTPYYHFDDDGTYPENDPNWTEHRIKNGFRYYYAIVPYDFGSDRHDEDIYIEPVVGGRVKNQASTVPSPEAKSDLSNVWVVPNPYVGSADWELWSPSIVRENKIAFMNLPGKCSIDIYTLAGEWVDRINYNDEKYGTAYWDLSNYAKSGRPGLRISSGVYIFRVSTPDGKELVDKFAIILGSDEEVK